MRSDPSPPTDNPGNPTVNFYEEKRLKQARQSAIQPGGDCISNRRAARRSCPSQGTWSWKTRRALVVEPCLTLAGGRAK